MEGAVVLGGGVVAESAGEGGWVSVKVWAGLGGTVEETG